MGRLGNNMEIHEVKKYMYVIVRNDLSSSYKMVQGSHALANFAVFLPDLFKEWDNNYLIFLGTPNFISLKKWWVYLSEPFFRLRKVAWYEPDLEGQMTAICLCAKDFRNLETIINLPLA
jgi:hypothetical protein